MMITEAIAGVIGTAMEKGKEKICEDDYKDETGLLTCAKCHTHKECVVTFLGKEKIVPCLCRCEAEKYNASVKQNEDRQRLHRVRELRRFGFSREEYKDWSFANDDRQYAKISDFCLKYVNNFAAMKKDGIGLIFHGSVGVGKTFYACCIANALIEREYSVFVTSLPELVNGMSDRRDTIIHILMNYSLVVIDDLGVERETEYSMEKVYEIIDARYKSGKPLIVTTNLTKDEIENPSDIKYKRIYDRISEMCMPIFVRGESRRKKKAENKIQAARELLTQE